MTGPVARHVLVFGDSLSFHGPDQPYRPSDPRLYPNVMAASLGDGARADLVARLGWTARDAWWALTKDPRVWGELVPRADALVLGVGQMDHLPAAIPTWVRESIPYVRPGGLRRRVRRAYATASPWVIRATGGRLRQLPQAATDHYLGRIVSAVHHYRPGIPVVLLGPSPHAATTYPSHRQHAPAVEAARAWALRHDVGFVDLDPIVAPSLAAGLGNPDGMHWAWDVHAAIGEALAEGLRFRGWPPPVPVNVP
jgi:diglucosylglycerate octanoyltransferase